MSAVFIGLMSGTSLDGVDGVLAEFGQQSRVRVLAHSHRDFPAALSAFPITCCTFNFFQKAT